VTAVVLGPSDSIERRHLALTALRTSITAAGMVLVYFVAPINLREHATIAGRLAVGLALFIAALAYEVRAIARARHPILRAAVAMALIIPLFIVVFSWTYLTMSLSSPAAFGLRFSRISALYFTVTVFSTVGFGDIAPKTDIARLVVTAQMLCDVVVVVAVVRLLLGVAHGALDKRSSTSENAQPLKDAR
jgi:voltage-gated potassium channel